MIRPKTFFSTTWFIIYAFILGVITSSSDIPALLALAEGVSKIFVNLLMLISFPLIFLSIVSTISGMESFEEMKRLGKITIKYTLSTTIVAATVAFFLFKLINPTQGVVVAASKSIKSGSGFSFYFSFLEKIIPSNIIDPFSSNGNVASIVFLAIILSLAILSLPKENKKGLHSFFNNLFAAILKITHFIIFIIPFGVWAFVTLVIRDMKQNVSNISIKGLFLYVLCIVAAYIVQSIIVLPIFLKLKKLSPLKIFKAMASAVMVAFFSRSSTTALPVSLKNATSLGISKHVSHFVLPLCTTINMNGAAIYIFITVLYVSISHGITFSLLDMILWIFIATFAAVGNAGLPMGAYFLASSFLATLDIPLQVMGVMLALNTFLDMGETALNVWSDVCITAVVNKELKQGS